MTLTKSQTNQKTLITKLTVTAMLTAIAVVLQYIEVSIPIIPSFIKLDFSDLPELICAYVLGPLYGVAVCFLKNLIHLPFGSSGGVGELSNFMLGAVFVFVAGIIFKYKSTLLGASIGAIVGALAMALVSLPSNYFIVYPAYAGLWFGGNMDAIVNMYKALLPSSDTLLKSLLIFNLPFTFAKGIIDAIIAIIVFKPLSKAVGFMDSSVSRKK